MTSTSKDPSASDERGLAVWKARRDMSDRMKAELPSAVPLDNRSATGSLEYAYDATEDVSRMLSRSISFLKRPASQGAADSEPALPVSEKAFSNRERNNQAHKFSCATGSPSTVPSALNMLEVPVNAEGAGFRAFSALGGGPRRSSYDDPTFSDVLVCIAETGEVIHGHKVILAKCELFLHWMTGPLMADGVLTLDNKCGTSLVLQALIRFVYEDRYDAQTDDTTATDWVWFDFSSHAELYIFASQRNLTALRDAVLARMTAWNRPWAHMTNFVRALRIIWTSSLEDVDVLKPRLALLCLRNLKDLATYHAFREVMEETTLGAAIALALVADNRGQRVHLLGCPCGRLFDQKGKIQCLGCNRLNNDTRGALPVEYYVQI
ncbi:hypothetical protein LTR95_004527 [Oleoguttula sp. CCFEE 5521]